MFSYCQTQQPTKVAPQNPAVKTAGANKSLALAGGCEGVTKPPSSGCTGEPRRPPLAPLGRRKWRNGVNEPDGLWRVAWRQKAPEVANIRESIVVGVIETKE